MLHQPQEMAGHKYPRGLRRLTTVPFPRKPRGKGRLVPQGPGPPQRAIQRRHLVPGAAGSWWAFLTVRTGAHYVESNHMGAQAARLSALRSAFADASLSLGACGARERRVPGSREGQILSAPRLSYLPGAESCIISISSVAGPGLGEEEEEGRKESASGKEAAASASSSLLST